jgi:serine/threonine protein kinase
MSSAKPQNGDSPGGATAGDATAAMRTDEVLLAGTASARPAHVWLPPTAGRMQELLPHYQFLGMIGMGGMGAVYKARHVALDRFVAVKILPPDMDRSGASNFAERFKQEARTMARLAHPCIVNVFDFGQTADGQLYFVMEFVDGTDVQKMIRAQKKLAPEQALTIAAHVCDALTYAHRHGVIHRDIKPANVLIDGEGRIKIADFGLAKATDPQHASDLTRSDIALGTPHFIAPEAMTAGMEVDHRADLYAVGVMLYNMLTGDLPSGMFKLPSQKTACDLRCDQIVARALDPDRESRYQSAADIRKDIDAIIPTPALRGSDTATGLDAKQTSPGDLTAPKTAPPSLKQTPAQEPAATETRKSAPIPKRRRSGIVIVSVILIAGMGIYSFNNRSGRNRARAGHLSAEPAFFSTGQPAPKQNSLAESPPAVEYPPAKNWTDDTAMLRRDGVGDGSLAADGDAFAVAKNTMLYLADGRKFHDAAIRIVFSGPPVIALMMRVNSVNRYAARINSGNALLSVFDSIARKDQKVLSHRVIAPRYDPATDHEMVFAVRGNSLALWIDGHEAGTARDESLASGPVGIFTPSDEIASGCRIKKVEFSELNGSAAAAKN